MGKVFGISGYMVRARRILPLMLALAVYFVWASAAHAQEAPFKSQYDPPPTTPAECDYSSDEGNSDDGVPASECEPPSVSDTEGPVEVLPTTGGLLAAPILLGTTIVATAGVFTLHRKHLDRKT